MANPTTTAELAEDLGNRVAAMCKDLQRQGFATYVTARPMRSVDLEGNSVPTVSINIVVQGAPTDA